ncbi:hypothetical protein KUV80_02610 [Fictibacillus nanhaiensis]|uniref:competence type IV pilus minor pilin ComGG n=1 Tax=Fictibacillus nanhaiensis TaxID=742169 RepID=UPI001C93FDD1|nr:competence type IV pilus minor pilin ComGG [Fictibacillus nanhaiensis]MBY6035521.1 hypothetical protein [Fictibacillus nanhaiensis]
MNEKGVVYPLMIALCFLMVAFLGYFTERVFSERHFVFMQEEQLRQIRLIQQAMDKASIMAQESTMFPEKHFFIWADGNVELTIDQTSQVEERLITIEAITGKQRTKKVKVYYNVTQNSVTKWVEG